MLVVLATVGVGCGRTVPGTAHAEGEGPPVAGPSASESATASVRAAPPTEFQEPTGRPTVTVQPDPLFPGAPTTEPQVPRPLPGTGGPPTTTPLAALPTGGAAIPDRGDRGESTPDRAGSTPDRTGSTPDRAGSTPDRTGSTPDRTAASPGGGGSARGAPAATAPLTADVVADECLLDAAGFAALLGGPVGTPAENEVTRSDGSRTRSCYATARSGPATAAVNVYRVNRGTPATFVRGAVGGRPLPGVGDGAVLLDTVGGSALQVATPRFLVTVSVVDGAPDEARWRAAGQAVATAISRR